jgi:hypothetical protein
LYQRANGYNYEAVKIFMPAGAKQPVVVHYVEREQLTSLRDACQGLTPEHSHSALAGESAICGLPGVTTGLAG